MFSFFKAGQEEAANGSPSGREAPLSPKEGEDNWSEDPHEKVVQLTRQLKVARGQLDKKSDFCDELANQLRRLEEDLEARDSAARETRALLNATGAEFRAAAHVGATERQEYAQDAALLQQRLGSLESEVEDLRGKTQEHSVLATSWIERESQLQRSEAELESQARAHAVKLNRLGALLSDEEESVSALSAQLAEGRQHLESELQHAELERTRQVTTVEEAAQAHISGESASFAQRLRGEATELESSLKELCAARSEGAAWSARLRDCEQDAASQERSREEALRRLAGEEASAAEKATTLGNTLERCRAELESSEQSLRADVSKHTEMCSQLREEHANEARAARRIREELASSRASLDASREETAWLRRDIDSRCEALKVARTTSESQQKELQDTRKNLLAECAATSKSFAACEQTLAARTQELASTEKALQEQTESSKKLNLDIERLKAGAKAEADRWHTLEQQTSQNHTDLLSASQAARTQLELKSTELQGHVKGLQAELVSKAKEMQDLADRLEDSESKQRSAVEAVKISEEALQAEIAAHGSVSEECCSVAQQFEEHKAAATAAAAQTATDSAQLSALVRNLREQLESAAGREKELSAALGQEKELHEHALKLLQEQRADNQCESTELQQELEHLSSELEQKEEDLLSTSFDMVTLQNKLNDQMQELTTNSNELRQSKEELADKDEKLKVALKRQDELVSQMNDACARLQEKVAGLSKELESSRAAYQTLDQQSRAVISRLESDRLSLTNELDHVRAELQGVTAQYEQARSDAAERLEAARSKHSLEMAEVVSTGEAMRKTLEQVEAEKEQLRAEMAKRESQIAHEHALLNTRCETAEKEHLIAKETVDLKASEMKELQAKCDEAQEQTSAAVDKHHAELGKQEVRISALIEELAHEKATARERCKVLSAELEDCEEQAAKHKLHASNCDEAHAHGQKVWAAELADARKRTGTEVAALHTELKEREDAAASCRSDLEAELRSAYESAEQRHRDVESQEAAGAATSARLQESLQELAAEGSRSEHLAQCIDEHQSKCEAQAADLHKLRQGHAAMQEQHQEATAVLLQSADEEKGSLIKRSELARAEVDGLREELQVSAQVLRAAQSSAEEEARISAMRAEGWKTEEAQLAEARRASEEQSAALELLTSQASSLERTLEARTQEATVLREELADHSTRSQRQVAQAQAALQRSEAEGVSCQEQLTAREAELQHALADARKRMEKHALGAADEASAREKKLAEQAAAAQQREVALSESLRLEADKARELQERMLEAIEKRDEAEERFRSCEAALERSRLLERQALEKAQELRTSLYLYREFGREDFMHATPHAAVATADASGGERAGAVDEPASANKENPPDKDAFDPKLEGPMSSNLITVELDLGLKSATVSVAIWHTRDDFDNIVEEFLKENRVKPIFKDALVKYLMEVEDEATTLPISVKANLSDVYSRYG